MKFRNIFTQKVVVLSILSGLCFSCSVSKDIEQDKEKLTGRWTLAKASFSDDLSKDFNGQIPYLQFDNKKGISGNGYDSCKRIDFKIKTTKNKYISIKFSSRLEGSGKIYDGGFSSYEDNEKEFRRVKKLIEHCEKVRHKEFTEALNNATSYKLKNDTILIFKSDEYQMEFHKKQ